MSPQLPRNFRDPCDIWFVGREEFLLGESREVLPRIHKRQTKVHGDCAGGEGGNSKVENVVQFCAIEVPVKSHRLEPIPNAFQS